MYSPYKPHFRISSYNLITLMDAEVRLTLSANSVRATVKMGSDISPLPLEENSDATDLGLLEGGRFEEGVEGLVCPLCPG